MGTAGAIWAGPYRARCGGVGDAGGVVELTLHSGGGAFPGVLHFAYYVRPRLDSIYPAIGPRLGGTSVTVSAARAARAAAPGPRGLDSPP